MKSIMWQYINEESSILKHNIASNEIDVLLDNYNLLNLKALYFIAHGSSYNAATVCSSIFSNKCNLRTSVMTPANLMFNNGNIDLEKKEEVLAVFISQTGTSRGVLEALSKVKEKGILTLGITEVKNSMLDQHADICLYLNVGQEDSNAKTKGYSATIVQLLLFAYKLALRKKEITILEYQEFIDDLNQEVNTFDKVYQKVMDYTENATYFREVQDLYVLGNGINFGSSLEGQLKLMETMCMPTMFNDIMEFPHGMHRSIKERSTVWILNTDANKLNNINYRTFKYLKSITDKVLMVNASKKEVEEEDVINLPYFRHDDSVLLITLIIQILSAYIPEFNGNDPNIDSNNDYTYIVDTRV